MKKILDLHKKTFVLILFVIAIVLLIVGAVAFIKIREKNYALREMTVEDTRFIRNGLLEAEKYSGVKQFFVISGTVDMTENTGKLSPVFSRQTRALGNLEKGEYSVELLDNRGSLLLKKDFRPTQSVSLAQYKLTLLGRILEFFCKFNLLNKLGVSCPTASSDSGGGFVIDLPYMNGVATIQLKHGSKILDQLKPGSNSPTIKINPVFIKHLPIEGEFKFSWVAIDPDNDRLYYEAYVSYDDQKSWIIIRSGYASYQYESYNVSRTPKSDTIYFQVLASDGINTASDTIGPFGASIKMPVAQIENPKNGDSIQQGWPLILMGSGNSPEEENTIPDERLIWSSDISGTLGNGQTLQVEKTLPKGKHVITLTVTDKYGNKSSASINLTIR